MSLNQPPQRLILDDLDENLRDERALICFEKLDINSNNNMFKNNENLLATANSSTTSSTTATAPTTDEDDVVVDDDEEEEEEEGELLNHNHLEEEEGELLENGDKSDEEEEEAAIKKAKDNEYLCNICNNRLIEPKLLSCLHTFCKRCLNDASTTASSNIISPTESLAADDYYQQHQLIQHNHVSSSSSSSTTSSSFRTNNTTVGSSSSGSHNSLITCPTCKQKTRMPLNGADGLEDDVVMHNMLETLAIEEMNVHCTSCKSNEIAVARCSDCPNNLCSSCIAAHEYMNCFENHRVQKFEELKDENGRVPPIHKPLYCKMHKKEYIKFFCTSCDIPICSDCIVAHHQHAYERINDTEAVSFLQPLQEYVTTAKDRLVKCEDQIAKIENYFVELDEFSETARGTIEETFQSYKAMLEMKKEQMLQEVVKQRKAKELRIMDIHNAFGDSTARLSDVIGFADRVTKNGNTLEVLLLKRHILQQFQYVFKTLPEPNLNIGFQFITDRVQFEKVVDECFGTFFANDDQAALNGVDLQDHMYKEQQQLLLQQQELNLKATANGLVLPTNFAHGLDIHQSPTSTEQNWFHKMDDGLGQSHALMNGLPGFNDNYDDQSPESPPSAQDWNNIGYNLQTAQRMNPLTAMQQGLYSGLEQQNLKISQQSPDSQTNTSDWLMNIPAAVLLNNLNGLQSNVYNNHNGAIGQRPFSPPTDPFSLMNGIGGGGVHHQISNVTSRSQTPGLHLPIVPNNTDDFYSNSMTQNLRQLQSISCGMPAAATTNVSSAPVSNHSQSPPASDAGTLSRFDGNGNLCPPIRSTKMLHMQMHKHFGSLGPSKGNFNSPHGFCLGCDEEIIVADTNNHRIQVFDKDGNFKNLFGVPGRDEGQLWYPRKVAVIRSTGKFVVCDRGNERSRMQIFNKNGHFVKKIVIRYMDIVAGLAITSEGHIVTVDSVSPTIFRMDESGELKKWFDCSEYMREPSDIAISGQEYFVCDFKGHCVVVFHEDGNYLRKIGGENVTNFPNGIDVSDAGDVLIGDSHGNRFHIAVFTREGDLLSEFECPTIKVSRCCGLKITSEGYVVTLAKNNHHVLVLNTLYVS